MKVVVYVEGYPRSMLPPLLDTVNLPNLGKATARGVGCYDSMECVSILVCASCIHTK